jgi:predicted nucleotidyltransferase
MILTEQKINSIKDIIVSKCDPAAIYIFGSYASGNATDQSDLDLLVINQTSTPNDRIGVEISKALFPRDYSLDLLVLNSDEIKKKIEKDFSFWKNILKNGKKIYERI